jgi:hypothetical protein
VTSPLPVLFSELDPGLAVDFEDAMRMDNLLIKGSGFRPNHRGLDFLEGFWWEGYVLDRLQAGLRELNLLNGAEIIPNLVVRWKGQRTKNEIDIAFNLQNRLYVISCTTAAETEAEKRREQIENFAQRFGGRFARAMLACTLEEDALQNLRQRKHNLTSIPAAKQWRNPSKILREWISGE